MRFSYGNFTHRDNEAKLMAFYVRHRLSDRGRRVSVINEMHLQIECTLPADGTVYTTATAQAWLAGRISQIINAYANDYGDAKFYHDDGTLTRHSMLNAGSLSGVRVVQRSWPSGDGAEYATTRTGYVVLRCEYPDVESQLYSLSEWVQSIGTGGPRWRMQDLETNRPRRYNLNQFTHQKVIQVGRATGFQGYPLSSFGPLYGPQFEHEDVRVVAPGHPRYAGNGFIMYPISWSFRFSLPIPQNSFPWLR